MGLVDDDGVPSVLTQVREVPVRFEGVDGGDDPFEIGERVAGGRQYRPDSLDPVGVETDERDRGLGTADGLVDSGVYAARATALW